MGAVDSHHRVLLLERKRVGVLEGYFRAIG